MSATLTNSLKKCVVAAVLAGVGLGVVAIAPAQAAESSPAAVNRAADIAERASQSLHVVALSAAPTAGATAAPAAVAPTTARGAASSVAPQGGRRPSGNWTYWGYRYTRAETSVIASISLWNAVSGAKGTRLIPYSAAIVAIYAYTWVLTARNALKMGQCLGITYSGTGLWVNCTA